MMPPRADADAFRGMARFGDDQRGRRRCNAGHAMMLGDPIAMIALRFGLRGDGTDAGDGVGGLFVLADVHEIEEGEVAS